MGVTRLRVPCGRFKVEAIHRAEVRDAKGAGVASDRQGEVLSVAGASPIDKQKEYQSLMLTRNLRSGVVHAAKPEEARLESDHQPAGPQL